MKSAVQISPVEMETRKALDLRAGDTVHVWQKIEELKQSKGADKRQVTTRTYRKQAFEGLVLAVKHGSEAGATFTVRKVASGVGVEKIFPLYSPMIDSVEVLRRTRTRRAKLYFIRRKAAKEIRHQMRRTMAMKDEPESVAATAEAVKPELAKPEPAEEAPKEEAKK